MTDKPKRVALVTGSAQGAGRGIAGRLASDGFDIVICDLDPEAVARAAEEISGTGATALGIRADVSDEQSVTDLFRRIDERFGRLDVAVNNAAVSPRKVSDAELSENTSLSEWSRVIGVNLTGPFLITRAATPLMKRNRWGRIVNVISRGARGFSPSVVSSYAASKSGLIGLTRVLAGELGAYGITVNSVSPSRMNTPMTRNQGSPEEDDRRAIAGTPIGRVGLPSDIAAAIAFFASDDSAYITGSILDVTGGSYMP